jgi:ABC-2 type transport system ATP-binding protein
MPPVIQFRNVKKRFGKRVILDGINLEIDEGEIFGIIGMSGSGKSTILNILIGYYEPEEGDILFYSYKDKKYKSAIKDIIELRKTFGFAAQDPSFYPKLTVEENLLHFGALYKLSKKTRRENAKHLLEMAELSDAKRQLAQSLSGGMEKRLSVACSLIHSPKVLILDEPTADLDPIRRRETWQLIKEFHKKGTTIIIASHFLSELEPVCTKIAILHDHKIAAVGTLSQLKKYYNKSSLEAVFESIEKRPT